MGQNRSTKADQGRSKSTSASKCGHAGIPCPWTCWEFPSERKVVSPAVAVFVAFEMMVSMPAVALSLGTPRRLPTTLWSWLKWWGRSCKASPHFFHLSTIWQSSWLTFFRSGHEDKVLNACAVCFHSDNFIRYSSEVPRSSKEPWDQTLLTVLKHSPLHSSVSQCTTNRSSCYCKIEGQWWDGPDFVDFRGGGFNGEVFKGGF